MRLAIVFGLALAALPTITAADTSERPNFVVIFIDDMGYGDIGPFGSTKNRTPHLDRMAAEGMKLTSFYAAPVCSASRAQLLTGCYAPRVSVPGVFFPAGKNGLHPDEHTIADYLGELGYATACIGKWHLGDQLEFLPTRQGFDSYFGIPYSNDMARKSAEDGRNVHPLMRDEEVEALIENEDQRQITRQYTEEAIAFIEEQHAAGKPFFLYLPHTAMHVPLYPHPDFVGQSANGTYGDWVEELDWSVGRVLDTLQRLELDGNTLVVFTSDNGPWASKGKAGGESGPLRGSKGGTLEGGVREPTIAWWPGKIEAGTASDAISGTTDLLPTLVGLAGGKLRESVRIDGHDLTPILRSEADAIPDRAWHYYRGTRLEAIRHGKWKLALGPQSLGMGIKEKPADLQKTGVRLYDLDTDIGETTDLAESHPEVVARLRAIADAMIADIGSGTSGPGVRPAGHVANPVTLYPTASRTVDNSDIVPARGMSPVDWMVVKPGQSYATFSAPEIDDQPFVITATITPDADAPEGVIVSHGGSSVGYTLYLRDGKAVFAVRLKQNEVHEVVSPQPLSGRSEIRAALLEDGKLSLEVGGQEAATTDGDGLIDRQPQEDLCIGFDGRNPVVDYRDAGDAFTGTLHALEVRAGN